MYHLYEFIWCTVIILPGKVYLDYNSMVYNAFAHVGKLLNTHCQNGLQLDECTNILNMSVIPKKTFNGFAGEIINLECCLLANH